MLPRPGFRGRSGVPWNIETYQTYINRPRTPWKSKLSMKTLWIRAYILFSSALQSGSVYKKDQNSVTVETFCLFLIIINQFSPKTVLIYYKRVFFDLEDLTNKPKNVIDKDNVSASDASVSGRVQHAPHVFVSLCWRLLIHCIVLFDISLLTE